jgi:hypothetical protein
MKKILLSLTLTLLASIHSITKAQQPMTISPGLNIGSPTAGTSGLKFNNLNSGTTVSTTPTKVLSLDATGNVILGNAASGGGSSTAINLPVYANNPARTTAIPTATTGMLTYMSFAGIGPQYFDGSSWISLNYWSLNNTLSRIISPSSGGFSIEAARFISQVPSTVASPVFAFAGPSTVFRYSGSQPDDGTSESITQETRAGIQPSTTSVVWNHYATTTSTPTRLFGFASSTFTVNGNQTIDGFTKLGGAAADVPAVKQKYITGVLGTTLTPYINPIAHGLTGTKIIAINVIVEGNQGNTTTTLQFPAGYEGSANPAPGSTGLGNTYYHYFDGTNVYIERSSTNGSLLLGSPYKILITYIQ